MSFHRHEKPVVTLAYPNKTNVKAKGILFISEVHYSITSERLCESFGLIIYIYATIRLPLSKVMRIMHYGADLHKKDFSQASLRQTKSHI